MKKKLNKLMALTAAALVLAFALGASVLADGSITVGIDQYKTQDGKIIVYVNHNQGEGFTPDAGDSAIVVGKQSLELESVSSLKDEGEPVSYMFVVDISGSMDESRVETAKEIITEFISEGRAGNNYCVVTMEDELSSTGFSDDTDELLEFVDAIERTRHDTNLYQSIKELLNVLQTDRAVHDKRCLVIFSDGADDQAVGITREEAETQVKDAHIPVFTVAMLPSNPKDADLESAKILGSFARASAGGVHYAPLVDEGIGYEDIYQEITGVIDSSLVLTADLADVTAGDGNVYLGVELSNGTEKGTDGFQIPVGNILDAIEEAQQASVSLSINIENPAAETQNEDVSEEAQQESGSPLFLIIAIAAVLVILLIVIVLVLVRSAKRKKRTLEEAGGEDSLSVQAGAAGFGGGLSAARKITLFKVGPGADGKYTLVLDGKKSIGRNSGCDLQFAEDTALSGVHCFLFSDCGRVCVQDNNSTNGTYVNGVPIADAYCVANDDVLLIGSAEYRIVLGK